MVLAGRLMQLTPEILVEKLVSAEFAIEQWELLGVGQNSIAILANEEWIFRYPLHASAAESLDSEIAALKAVHGRLPVPTPSPEIVADVPGLEWRGMGYPAVGGETLDRSQIGSFNAEAMTRLGRDLGRFMNTLHSTPASRFSKSALRNRDSGERWERLASDAAELLKSRVESSTWNRLNRKLKKSIDKIKRLEFEPVLRHGDFGSGNFLFDQQSHLSGVIDFGSAGFGDPAVDVAGLIATDPSELLVERVRATYPAIDGMIARARIYRETFALEHALLGAKSDDELEIKDGLDSYLGT